MPDRRPLHHGRGGGGAGGEALVSTSTRSCPATTPPSSPLAVNADAFVTAMQGHKTRVHTPKSGVKRSSCDPGTGRPALVALRKTRVIDRARSDRAPIQGFRQSVDAKTGGESRISRASPSPRRTCRTSRASSTPSSTSSPSSTRSNVDGVEPMTSVTPMAMKQREDVVTDGEIAEKIVANAPASEDDYFLVPKVVE